MTPSRLKLDVPSREVPKPHERDWTRIGAIATITALIIGVPTIVLAVRELSATSNSRVTGPPAGQPRLTLSPSGTLSGDFAVERKDAPGTWAKELHGVVPGDVVTWKLHVGDYSDRVSFMHVIARVVLAPHLAVIPQSVRLVSERGDRQQADAPLFKGGFDIGNYAPGGGQYLLFDTRLQPDFKGCVVRIENIADIRAEGIPETRRTEFSARRLFADVVIGKPAC
jgi:hypothetical protein